MIVVGTTFTYFALSHEDRWSAWLSNHEALRRSAPGHSVRHFAALQLDGRPESSKPFQHAKIRLLAAQGDWWEFALNDGRAFVNMVNRRRHIAMGQSLVVQYAVDEGAEWLLLLAADFRAPDDVLPRFLEAHAEQGHKALTGVVPAHPRRGVPLAGAPKREVIDYHRGFLFLHRDLFTQLRFRSGPDYGEELALKADVNRMGDDLVMLTNVVGEHFPRHVTPYETRYSGEDLAVRW